MSVKNFIPEIYAAGVMKDRDKVLVAVNHCNRDYEGQIKAKGDRVKISQIGDVTVKDYVRNTDIADPEIIQDADQYLDITESKYFHIFVDDVDKAQADEKLRAEQQRKAGIALADVMDQFVFEKYTEAGNKITKTNVTSANILGILALAEKAALEANIPNSEIKYFELSPQVYIKFVLAKILKDTDNSATLTNGEVGKLFNFVFSVSNNVVQDGALSHCMIRTKQAISFAEQINEVEAYKPEKRFGDAVKGLQLYGGKVVKPKELITLDITVADETTI
jgi:hypothetical protein